MAAPSTLRRPTRRTPASHGDARLGHFHRHPAGHARSRRTPRCRRSCPRASDGDPPHSRRQAGLLRYLADPQRGRLRSRAAFGAQGCPAGRRHRRGRRDSVRPDALEQRRKNFESRATTDPRGKVLHARHAARRICARAIPDFQRPRDITIAAPVRTLGAHHPHQRDAPSTRPDRFLARRLSGRWDGDTLVVDVADFNGKTWLDRAGNFHSDQLHVVERWRLLDANTIEYKATLEDPQVYTRPWSIGRAAAPASRARLPADRELLLHAGLRTGLPGADRHPERPSAETDMTRFVIGT